MVLRIHSTFPNILDETIANVLNVACVYFGRGYMPTDRERVDPKRSGEYWYYDKDARKYEIISGTNNYKAFVRGKKDDYILLEFFSRYDKNGSEVATLNMLILSMFPDYVTIQGVK